MAGAGIGVAWGEAAGVITIMVITEEVGVEVGAVGGVTDGAIGVMV